MGTCKASRQGWQWGLGIPLVILIFSLGIFLVACGPSDSDADPSSAVSSSQAQGTTALPTEPEVSTKETDDSAKSESQTKPEDEPTTESTEPTTSDEATPTSELTPTEWSESESPNYVRLVGKAHIESPLEPGQVQYAPLDELGRTRQVSACITKQMMDEGRARKRGDMPDPSGWPARNQKSEISLPTGRTYHGYFWNRCHLLAKSLGGEEVRENLVTGTRMLNVGANDGQGGMDMYETAIRDWLSSYPNVTVQYVATPVYQGNELIPRSVYVDVLSSDGTINERLETYNAAKGHTIDYTNGTFQ